MNANNLGTHMDSLTEALRDAEDALASMRLGVSAKAPLGPEHFLLWEKNGANWALRVQMLNGEKVTLGMSSRKLRIMAADSLPALLGEILFAYENLDREVIVATQKVQAFSLRVRNTRVKEAKS